MKFLLHKYWNIKYLASHLNVIDKGILDLSSQQTRFESCRVRGTIMWRETNLRQSGGIGANRVKKSRRMRGVSHDTIFSPDSITQNLCLVPFISDQQHF